MAEEAWQCCASANGANVRNEARAAKITTWSLPGKRSAFPEIGRHTSTLAAPLSAEISELKKELRQMIKAGV